jgi:hypothetical protein
LYYIYMKTVTTPPQQQEFKMSTITPTTEEEEIQAIFPEAYLKRCECRGGCPCELSAGPAAVEISRKGKFMWVCTRCTLSGDTKFGIVEEKAQQEACLEYDPLFVLDLMRVADSIGGDE